MQTAQAVHAAFLFSTEFPSATGEWHTESNYVVVLSCRDEASLLHHYRRLPPGGRRALVHEPDCFGQATAFAALGPDVGRTLSSLPLAGKEMAMA